MTFFKLALARGSVAALLTLACSPDAEETAWRTANQAVDETAPPGTPPPVEPGDGCPDGRQPSPPNRTIACPFMTESEASSGWTKECASASFGGYLFRCSGTCTVTFGLFADGLPDSPPYCAPGGPGTDPYLDGCDEEPIPAPVTLPVERYHGSELIGEYSSLAACQQALASFNCNSGGTIDAACASSYPRNVTYEEQYAGRCCQTVTPKPIQVAQ